MNVYQYASEAVSRSRMVRDIQTQAGLKVTPLHSSPRLPRDFSGTFHMDLYDWRGRLLGDFQVTVRKGSTGKRRGASPHRIFVAVAGRNIPVGRLAQAKHRD